LTLLELAELFFDEICKVQPDGPYFFAGHSFGATVCLEMVRIAEKKGTKVAMVALLDPRSLPPLTVDVGGAFAATELADTLALLTQTAPDGSRYADLLQDVSSLGPAERDAAVQRALNPAALASLEHVHETSKWYSSLLGAHSSGSTRICRSGCVAVLRAAETWRQEPLPEESTAEKMVRTFQAETFQSDAEVMDRLTSQCAEGSLMAPMKVPGTHFSMFHEPDVATVARRICRVLDEAADKADS